MENKKKDKKKLPARFPNDQGVMEPIPVMALNINNKIDQLLTQYICKNYIDLKSFLNKHSEIVNIIVNAHTEIKARFNDVQPIIELVKDPDVQDWETIVISIPTSLDFKIAFEKLNSILQDWAFLQTSEFKRIVTISIS